MMREIAATWCRVLDAFGEPPRQGDEAPLHPQAIAHARTAADALMAAMADHAGATVFCDKSLTTVNDLSVVSQCYPEAAFIFLYRFPLDMVASGIEAQKWGYHSYGFGPYIRNNPANFVSALTAYWIDRTARMVEFERSCKSPHIRVQYERLCDDPEGTLARLLEFLNLPADDSIVSRALATPHQSGMADYKVDFRTSIGSESIGRGASLPRLITSQQQEKISEILIELEYPSLEDGWRGGLAELLGLRGSAEPSDGDDVIEYALKVVTERAADPSSAAAFEHAPFDIIVHTRGREVVIEVGKSGSVALRDGSAETDGARGLQFICRDDVLLGVLGGEMSLADAINDLRVRIIGAGDTSTVRGRADNRKLFAAVGTLLGPFRP